MPGRRPDGEELRRGAQGQGGDVAEQGHGGLQPLSHPNCPGVLHWLSKHALMHWRF